MSADGPAAPPTPHATRWWADALWLVALATYSAGWCLTAAPELGLTYDEPFYLDAGLASWRGWRPTDGHSPGWRHETAATNGVMPLPPDVVTFPLYVAERRAGTELTGEEKFARLRWARAMTLGWFWLLVISAWRLGWAAGGPWAGRIASGLLACDPNFLAHASLATTDIAVSAALMAFTRAVYAGRGGGWWKRVVLPGLWYGVAALCKLSGLLYGGFILVALEIAYRFATGALSRPQGASVGTWLGKAAGATVRSVLAAAAVVAIGLVVAILYCGFPAAGERPFAKVARAVPPEEPLKPKYVEWAAKVGRVPHAASAFAFQWWWNDRGRPTFLNGTYYPEGYRWFFPELLPMKLPVPIVVLALAALLRPRAVANPVALAALFLFAVLLKANLQLGLRLALPAVAVGYVALAVAVARGYPRRAPFIGLPAVAALAVVSAWWWPHALGYLNQPSGGREAAPRRVSDSNLDWGQGLPDLAEWHAANGKPPMVVWYFGTDLRYFKRLPGDPQPFQMFPLESLPVASGEDLRKWVGPQVLAVGFTVLTMHTDAPPAKVAALEYLRTRRPLARTATFLLYDFRDPNGPPPLDPAAP